MSICSVIIVHCTYYHLKTSEYFVINLIVQAECKKIRVIIFTIQFAFFMFFFCETLTIVYIFYESLRQKINYFFIYLLCNNKLLFF